MLQVLFGGKENKGKRLNKSEISGGRQNKNACVKYFNETYLHFTLWNSVISTEVFKKTQM